MKNLLFILPMVLVLLIGCRPNFYQYQKDLKIVEKKQYGDACEYIIKGRDIGHENFACKMKIIMPDNFGEVGDSVTITNGLQAWPKDK